jgi:hypothetical protein
MGSEMQNNLAGHDDIGEKLEQLLILVKSYNNFAESVANDAVNQWFDSTLDKFGASPADVPGFSDSKFALALGAADIVKKAMPLEEYISTSIADNALPKEKYRELQVLCTDFVQGTSYMKTFEKPYTAKVLKDLGLKEIPDFR